MKTAQKKQAPWQARPDLMDILIEIQNGDTSVDVVTFAGFMETEGDLALYVAQKAVMGDGAMAQTLWRILGGDASPSTMAKLTLSAYFDAREVA